jgi:hypothetical protein
MRMRLAGVLLFCGMISLSGCSVLDPFNMFGRNTDGSSNWGRKPTPVQQGPIAGTYTRPGNTVSPPPVNSTSPGGMPPVIVTTPAQAAPTPSSTQTPPQNLPPATLQPPSEASPLMPPSPPGLGAMDSRQRTPGTIIQTQADFNALPVNQPSINTVTQTQVEVKGPAIDLTMPGAPTQSSPAAGQSTLAPMLAPNTSVGTASPSVTVPSIDSPMLAAPSIPEVMLPSMPAPAKTGRTLNPGTKPPVMPAPPQVPPLSN